MGTIANVLTGVATLGVRQPNDARAEWSATQYQAGTHSVKLSKTGSGDAGSTHLQLTPPTGITFTAFCANATAGAPTVYSFYHKAQNGVTGNYLQMEFRFEDPDSEAWCEFTVMGMQGFAGLGLWTLVDLATDAAVANCGYGGVGETGGSFFQYGVLIALTGAAAAITGAEANITDCGPWIMSRVRLELWESDPARNCYVDTVVINGVAYAIEPGSASAVGLSLSSPFTDVGYTEDGVTLEYTADEADIEVEEETFAIDRVITKETAQITCNMAESSLYNINKAMAGSVLSGPILTLGAGVNKTMNLKIAGTNPAGFHREIFLPLATATGAVGMSYKKGVKTVVPVTFQALKPSGEPAVTIVDNAA